MLSSLLHLLLRFLLTKTPRKITNIHMGKIKKSQFVTVKKFYTKFKLALGLELVNGEEGFNRPISEATINRPGLAMAGFFSYFADKRVQVFGSAEIAYLRKLPSSMRVQRMKHLCETDVPCIVFARSEEPPSEIIEVANDYGICVFNSNLVTMKFINIATIKLEAELADSITMHASMVDIRGIGVLIRGHSGVGKSETAIGLIERGGCLVADDVVVIRNIGDELMTSAPEVSRGFIEVRGLGIVNVTNLFGMGCLRMEKRLDLAITLKSHTDLNNVDRLGLERGHIDIMGISVPHVELPVAPGRDSARLIEVAANDHQLKILGFDMAKEFSNRIFRKMNQTEIEEM